MDARDIDLGLLRRLNAQDSLSEYIRQAWGIVEPTTPLRSNWHADCIDEHLEALAEGQITRLLINVMPRSGKSLHVSVFFPTWLWVKRPEERLVFASYSAALSTKLSIDRRAVIQSRWYQSRWGGRVRLADDANLKTEFQNTARGHMIATSVDASITGKGGNFLVVDDLINPSMANSELEREGAIRWYAESMGSRLDNPATGRICVIEQRTNQADLSGTLLAQGGWTHLCLPAEFDRRTTIVFPRSGREVTREPGDLLWPERAGRVELAAARVRLGEFAFNTQYLQLAVARGGNLIKRDKLRFYHAAPRHFDRVVQSWDTAFSTARTADYSACLTVGEIRERHDGALPGFYILSGYRGRIEFAALKALAVESYHAYRPELILVEQAASGQSLVQELRTGTNLPIKAIKPDGDKYSRVAALDPVFDAGQLYLPADGGAWVEELIAEATAFPAGPHDDWVDALTQAINFLRHQVQPRVTVREMEIGGGGVVFYDSAARGDSGYHHPENAGAPITTLGGARFISPDEPEPAPVPSGLRISDLPGHEPGAQ